MNVPKKESVAYKIAEMICKVGQKEFAEIVDIMVETGMDRKTVRVALTRMRKEGWVSVEDKKYSPSSHVGQHFGIEQPAEVFQPRAVSEKRSLSPQYIPCMNPLLKGRFRTDISFKNGSIYFNVGYSATGGLPTRKLT